jgi:fermentation-respiration switch protein FrsA (DUF1100 family)
VRPVHRILKVKVHPILLLALAVLAVYFGRGWFENLNLYFPSRQVDLTPKVYGIAYEEVSFASGDGTRLNGWWIPASGAGHAPVLLLCHGNAGNMGSRVEKVRILHELGLALFLFDYRGYGKSKGSPSEKGLYEDARAAYRYLTEQRKIPARAVILHGESLGGAVAVELATRLEAGAVITESTFTSVVDMGRRYFPFLPIRFLVTQNFDSLSKIRKVRAPILVLHSPEDDIVPFEMGRRLFEAAPEPKAFSELRGDHNDGFAESGALYPQAIRAFLNRTLKPEYRLK